MKTILTVGVLQPRRRAMPQQQLRYIHMCSRACAVERGGSRIACRGVDGCALPQQERAHMRVAMAGSVVQWRVISEVAFVGIAHPLVQQLLNTRQVAAKARAAQPALEVELVQRLLHRLLATHGKRVNLAARRSPCWYNVDRAVAGKRTCGPTQHTQSAPWPRENDQRAGRCAPRPLLTGGHGGNRRAGLSSNRASSRTAPPLSPWGTASVSHPRPSLPALCPLAAGAFSVAPVPTEAPFREKSPSITKCGARLPAVSAGGTSESLPLLLLAACLLQRLLAGSLRQPSDKNKNIFQLFPSFLGVSAAAVIRTCSPKHDPVFGVFLGRNAIGEAAMTDAVTFRLAQLLLQGASSNKVDGLSQEDIAELQQLQCAGPSTLDFDSSSRSHNRHEAAGPRRGNDSVAASSEAHKSTVARGHGEVRGKPPSSVKRAKSLRKLVLLHMHLRQNMDSQKNAMTYHK